MNILLSALSIVSGAMITGSLAPFKLWPLAILACALLYYVVINAKSKKNGFLYLLLFSLSLHGTGSSWVYISIHEFGNTNSFMALLITIVWVLFLSLVNAFCWLAFLYLKNKVHSLSNTLLFASIGTAVEALRSWLFTGFPWLFIGYSQTEGPLAGWAPLVGVYGITFILLLSGAICSQWIIPLIKKTKSENQSLTVITSIVLIICWLTGPLLFKVNWTTLNEKKYTASLIQTNISQHDKWNPRYFLPTLSLYRSMSSDEWRNSDLIIWPEASIPTYYDRAADFFNEISDIASSNNAALLAGVPIREKIKDKKSKNYDKYAFYNASIVVGNGKGIYKKHHLVPYGEYIPFYSVTKDFMQFFELPVSTMSPGKKSQPPSQIGDFKAKPLICYEIVYPGLTAKAAQFSDVLITISNDAWFGTSIGPLQHLQMAQMRALENGRYMLRSTGTGVTAIIDNKGKIVKDIEPFTQDILRGDFYTSIGDTPWTSFGHWLIHIVYSCIALTIIAQSHLRNPD